MEFHFLGWAHTRGDGFVYLPKEKILCTGDAVVNGPYNYMGDGNSANWPNVEISDDDKEIRVIAQVPGMEEKDIEVLLDSGTLTLRGEKKAELKIKDRGAKAAHNVRGGGGVSGESSGVKHPIVIE